MMRFFRKQNHTGFTLVETAIVLGVAGLIIAGIWTGTNLVNASMKKKRLSEQTLQFTQAVRNLYANQANTLSLGTGSNNVTGVTLLIDAGLVPNDMIKGQAGSFRLENVYGGTIRVNSAGNSDDTRFILTLDRIPTDGCIDLVDGRLASSQKAADDYGLVSITGAGGAITEFPLSERNRNAVCGSGSRDQEISFRFDLN